MPALALLLMLMLTGCAHQSETAYYGALSAGVGKTLNTKSGH